MFIFFFFRGKITFSIQPARIVAYVFSIPPAMNPHFTADTASMSWSADIKGSVCQLLRKEIQHCDMSDVKEHPSPLKEKFYFSEREKT